MAENPTPDTSAAAQTERPRRRFDRAQVLLPTSYVVEVQDGDETLPTEMNGTVTVLGLGGLRLLSAQELAQGTLLAMRFALPGGSPMLVRGRVVMSYYRAAESAFEHGLAFTHVLRGDKDSIVRFIGEATAKEANES